MNEHAKTGQSAGSERYCLLPYVVGPNRGRWAISRQVGDTDFDPPIFQEVESFGPFESREAARQFMVRRGSDDGAKR